MKLIEQPMNVTFSGDFKVAASSTLSEWWALANGDLQPRPAELAEADSMGALDLTAVRDPAATSAAAGSSDSIRDDQPIDALDLSSILDGFDTGDLVAAPLSPERRAALNGDPERTWSPRVELRVERPFTQLLSSAFGVDKCLSQPLLELAASARLLHATCRSEGNPLLHWDRSGQSAGLAHLQALWELSHAHPKAEDWHSPHASLHSCLAVLRHFSEQQQALRVHDSVSIKAAQLVRRLLLAHNTIRERADWLSGSFSMSVARSARPVDIVKAAKTHSFIVVSVDTSNGVWLAWSSADLHLPKEQIAMGARACMERWLQYTIEHDSDARVLELLSDARSLHQFARALGVREEHAVRRIAACLRHADSYFVSPEEPNAAEGGMPSFGLVVADPSQPCLG